MPGWLIWLCLLFLATMSGSVCQNSCQNRLVHTTKHWWPRTGETKKQVAPLRQFLIVMMGRAEPLYDLFTHRHVRGANSDNESEASGVSWISGAQTQPPQQQQLFHRRSRQESGSETESRSSRRAHRGRRKRWGHNLMYYFSEYVVRMSGAMFSRHLVAGLRSCSKAWSSSSWDCSGPSLAKAVFAQHTALVCMTTVMRHRAESLQKLCWNSREKVLFSFLDVGS